MKTEYYEDENQVVTRTKAENDELIRMFNNLIEKVKLLGEENKTLKEMNDLLENNTHKVNIDEELKKYREVMEMDTIIHD